MLLYPLPALLNPFPGTFPGTKNEGIPPSSPFSALMTSFPDIAFISEEANGCINEEAIGAINEAAIRTIIASRNPPFCFSISCFTVSVAPSINRPDFSSDSTTTYFSCYFSYFSSLAKGKARSNNAFVPKLSNVLPRNPPD